MDITSLTSDVSEEPLGNLMIPLAPATTSMGDQQLPDIDGVDSKPFSVSSKMATTINDSSSKNFLDYHNNLVLGGHDLNLTSKVQLFPEPQNKTDSVHCLGEKSNGNMGSDKEDPVDCDNCDREFPSLQQFMDHQCSNLQANKVNRVTKDANFSDAESFNGKIVYNPDGSAYIIEESESNGSDNDSLLDIPQQDGAIVDNKGTLISSSPVVFPQIANAFFVPRNPGSVLKSVYQSSLSPSSKPHQTPIMHSYRVYDVRTKDNNNDSECEDCPSEQMSEEDGPSVPTKPILMCFICRLSFGYSKSFHCHAATEHSMKLSEKEKRILNSKNASAIIQGVGKDKHPLMSFLEPVSSSDSPSNNNISQARASSLLDNRSSTSVSFVHTKPKSVDSVVGSSSNSPNPQFPEKLQYSSNLWGSSSTKPMPEPNEVETNNNLPNEPMDSSDEEGDSIQPKLVINSSASNIATNSLSVSSIMDRKGSPKVSADTSLLSSPLPLPQNTSAFLGMCDEHPQGRLQGVECPKCDIVLSSSQSLGGHMTMMHSRNSCKTLKCPKCNWHYKYQETLDIHMKEKHPENDAQCMYCISNQSHPRLARGETYSCGYKPYRCEVCNYSTTTKGNLSIHMQSDKHINNMQDLANGSTEMKMPPSAPPTPTTPSFPDESQFKKLQKPKQTWRCDVCNYETTVARNLRIHMTSEKHTHNMMVLQQNMKHMQQDMHMQMNQLMMLGQQDHSLFGLPSPMGGGMFPYDQSMLMAGIPPGFEIPVNLSKENGAPMETEDIPDAAKLFHCCVCNNFTSDSLEALHQHLQHDRTKQQENDHVTVSAGTYLCNLCSYKTNLKANFQLHSKTDKHIQRLQLVNHIKEGGAGNEWRLKYLNVSNPVQVRCNSCDYYTNSIHKLNVHTTNLQHESSAQLFRHLQYEEAKLNTSPKYYHCAMCQYSTKVKLNLIHHVQSVQHLQNDAAYKNQAKEDGSQNIEIDQIFQVRKLADDDSVNFDEDEEGDLPENIKLGETEAPEVKVEGSSTNQSSSNNAPQATVSKSSEADDLKSANDNKIENVASKSTTKVKWYQCPLCQDEHTEITQLKSHLLKEHNVKPEGLERILSIAELSESSTCNKSQEEAAASLGSMPNADKHVEINWDLLEADHAKLVKDEVVDTSVTSDKGEERQYRCQTCSTSFGNIDQLYAHQNELGHLELKQTPRGPGYLCWKKGCNQYFKTAQALQVHFREIHARRNNLSEAKFTCSECSLAFLSEDKLIIHSQYHLVKAVTSCPVCSTSMKGIQQLLEHLETAHTDIGKCDLDKHVSDLNSKACELLSSPEFEKYIVKNSASVTVKSSTSGNGQPDTDMREEGDDMSDNSCYDEESEMFNNSAISDENVNATGSDGDKAEGDMGYKEQQFMEDYMNSQAIAEGSYEDPNRKFKCHRCKVAFTKQSYLTSHNKTLQHRRGEKVGYPVDRYMDPNRPFKCDVCKESFTQKSILLVHYNSVSHLHKLKQVAHPGSTPPLLPAPSLPTPPAPPATTSSPPSSSSSPSTATASSESGRRPYRCNICRVAYNQGATLDVHIRSVGHQTRAAKIHELAVTGRLDVTLPLIENPDLGKVSTQQAQALTDMIHQTQAQISVSNIHQGSLIFPGMPGLPMLPGMQGMVPHSSSPSPGSLTSGQPISTSSSTISKSETTVIPSKSQTSSSTTSTTSSSTNHDINMLPVSTIKQEHDEENHDKPEKKEVQPKEEKLSTENTKDKETNNNTSLTCQKCNSTFANQESLVQHQKIYCYIGNNATNNPHNSALARPRNVYGRFKPQVQKNLLENIGFECVMQFNEFTQPCPIKKEKVEENLESRKEEVQDVEMEDNSKAEKANPEIKKESLDMPEMNRSHCGECKKEFSSVWVLKAHQEEVHKDIVPISVVETFGAKFKIDFETKQPKETEPHMIPQASSSTEKPSQQEMPPPPPPSQMPNHFDISQLMPMFGMMPMPLSMMPVGLHSPLMPMMLPGMDMPNFMPHMPPMMDSNFASAQQQMQQAAAANQKRVRTRISDEQLKILRAHFDITNSPSDDQIKQMSDQSGLPQKVIKHWFRNTLFKERQRNKDSPYNFNNPPSTSIDLDEYEKTGKIPDMKQEPSDDEENGGNDIDMDSEKDRYELCYKPEAPRLTIVEDRKEYECRSNASTPSTTSSIPSTPNTSIPNTPTPFNAMYDDQHNSYDHSMQTGTAFRRANRTRFTDYQIKMLQEYFEQNAYPKDDELDHLSKMLSLSPRVIVVWFQNARQKARKIYENQPASEAKEPVSPFQRTPGLNYQCKKCSAVFQRYYELIKHQKRMCNADAKNKNNVSSGHASTHSMAANSAGVDESFNEEDDSDSCISPGDDTNHSSFVEDSSSSAATQISTFKCEKCDVSFNRLSLWQEHQAIHNINPTLFQGFPSNSAFDILKTLGQTESGNSGLKRKFDNEDDSDQPRDKRLRTTILPEQLDYLYQKYQLDCNPSRKQLENISREVGLKKRVVQVWFQNTRARERKGQYRAHQQIIHKRCPFCRALFRAKSALESHLATKHPEEMAKREFNIDTIPDASLDGSPPTPQSLPGSLIPTSTPVHDLNKLMSPSMSSYLPYMSQSIGFSPGAESVQMSMQQVYEDSFKKYISDLSSTPKNAHSSTEGGKSSSKRSETESKAPSSRMEDDTPLDLSKPVRVSTDNHDKTSDGPSTDISEYSMDERSMNRRISMDDSISDTMSEAANEHGDEMNSYTNSPSSPSSYNNHINKRYRTQMTSMQVKVMKTLFTDYKTPTMAECELLGREIGLPKRVIQVWFQNARAKEKKSKLTYGKGFASENDYPKSPEECKLCNFKYSHKFTVQDHIFTKKHIDNVRKYISSQNEAEREMSDQAGVSSLLRQQRDMDRMRKVWDETKTPTSHLAQLQAMGLNAMGLSGSASTSSSNSSSKGKIEKKEKKDIKTENAPTKEQAAEMAMNAQMMSALGGFLPGMDPNFLSYMYPGLPGFYPGLGMSMMQPGLFPGAEHVMAYDPLAFGTPLTLLQIPQQAIKQVGEKLSDPKSTRAQYTQDCKHLADLKTMVCSTDYRLIHESLVDVGYICKKCQMVYPAKEACVNHQQSLCFPGGKIPENVQPMLKLEQIQYECKPCAEKVSSLYEMKAHCQLDAHKLRVAKYIKRKSASGNLPVSVASSLSPNKHRSTPSHDNNFQNSVAAEPAVAQPKIE